jgi:hypothetical protein
MQYAGSGSSTTCDRFGFRRVVEDSCWEVLQRVLDDASRRTKGVVARLCHRMCETMDGMLSGFLLLAASGDQPADPLHSASRQAVFSCIETPGQEPSSHPVRSKPCRGLPAICSHSSTLASRFSAFVCEQLGSDPEQAVREMVRVTGPGGVVAAALWDFHGEPQTAAT